MGTKIKGKRGNYESIEVGPAAGRTYFKPFQLNVKYANEQDLCDEDILEISEAHLDMRDLFAKMKTLNPEKQKAELKACALELQDIEFQLQRGWHFPANHEWHIYWFQAPHCKCPSMDNRELQGVDRRIINGSCPVHGNG